MKHIESTSSQKVIRVRRGLVLATITPLLTLGIIAGLVNYFNHRNDSKTSAAQLNGKPPYDPSAIFNTPIPNNYPSDSRSAAVINKWASVMSNNNGIFFAINGEVPGVYKSNNSSPLYTISGGVGGTFRVPSNAQAGGGSDYPLEVINTDTLQELRVWRATVNNTSKTISGEGMSLHYFNNDGSIKNPNGTKSVGIPYTGGGAGNGLTYYAGMITKDDWDSGSIRHALRIAYNNCSFVGGSFRIPATKSDQPKGCGQTPTTDSVGGMEMGMILQLDKSVNCDARTSPTGQANDNKFVRMVCHAMQDYGIMISDGTGASANFYMENENTAGWGTFLTKSSAGHLGNHFRNPGTTNGVPWNMFRVVSKPASTTSWGAGTPSTPSTPTTPTTPTPITPTPTTPTPTLAKPIAPAGVKLTPGDHKITVTWNASPSSEKVDNYQVYLNGSYSYATVTSPTYTITGTPGQTFSVRVSAHNSTGYGPWTDSYSAVVGSATSSAPPTTTPSTPTIPTTPKPSVEVPNANPTTPVDIPKDLPKEEGNILIADFNGDGLNDVAKDNNGDNKIDPISEIVVDGKNNKELTDTSDTSISSSQYREETKPGNVDSNSNKITIKAGPLPEAKVSKKVAYGFVAYEGIGAISLGGYLAMAKLGLLAAVKRRLFGF